MNKEKLYEYGDQEFHCLLYLFFKSNICIHKCATLQSKVGDKWEDIFTPSSLVEYRIKPSEPVYEWYCLYKPMQSTEWQPNGFMSQSEITEWRSSNGENWCITFVEKTKRERK